MNDVSMKRPPPILILFIAMTMVTGCRARPRVAIPSALVPAASREWVDLEPGCRVRVITPVLSSGGYLIKTEPPRGQSADRGRADTDPSRATTGEITLSTGPNFIGYEVSLYGVKPRRGGGVSVIFDSAEIHKQGQVIRSRQPTLPLFRLPGQMRWVRILHLARGSHDYDSAILAATRRDTLEGLTRQVQSDPSVCKTAGDAFCSWIPHGIAAIPESRRDGQAQDQWICDSDSKKPGWAADQRSVCQQVYPIRPHGS